MRRFLSRTVRSVSQTIGIWESEAAGQIVSGVEGSWEFAFHLTSRFNDSQTAQDVAGPRCLKRVRSSTCVNVAMSAGTKFFELTWGHALPEQQRVRLLIDYMATYGPAATLAISIESNQLTFLVRSQPGGLLLPY